MNTGITVTQAQIDAILTRATITTQRLGPQTCAVHVKLANGFEITETAACVDAANYDEQIGRGIALKRICDRLWLLEGWRLACRVGGEP